MKSITYKPDSLGALASLLCLVHCALTPFIFISQACVVSCCEESPVWWQSIDYLFLIISFFAIYKSAKTSSNRVIKKLLWFFWCALCLLILNKSIQLFSISHNFMYSTAIFLSILHLYNLRYCQCKSKGCCVEK